MVEEEVIYLQSLDQTVARFISVLVLKGSHGGTSLSPVPRSDCFCWGEGWSLNASLLFLRSRMAVGLGE